jgi:chemotaxis protein MotB
MANPEHQEIFIIKRHPGHDDAPHGGAWKIAFADFMTAMMALFLVLWLISSTSEKTKHTVAQYFNPVKLVDMTTLKKGFRDPKETEMGSGPNVKESQDESKTSQRNPAKGTGVDVTCKAGPDAPALTETALFRDPYAVLAEIAASAPAASQASSPGMPAGAAKDPSTSFSDPFTTTPHEAETARESLLPLTQSSGAQDKESQEKETAAKEAQLDESKSKDINDSQARTLTSTPIQKDPAGGAAKSVDQQGSVNAAEIPQTEKGLDAARAAAVAKLKFGYRRRDQPRRSHVKSASHRCSGNGRWYSHQPHGRRTLFNVCHRFCGTAARNGSNYGKNWPDSERRDRLHCRPRPHGWASV